MFLEATLSDPPGQWLHQSQAREGVAVWTLAITISEAMVVPSRADGQAVLPLRRLGNFCLQGAARTQLKPSSKQQAALSYSRRGVGRVLVLSSPAALDAAVARNPTSMGCHWPWHGRSTQATCTRDEGRGARGCYVRLCGCCLDRGRRLAMAALHCCRAASTLAAVVVLLVLCVLDTAPLWAQPGCCCSK